MFNVCQSRHGVNPHALLVYSPTNARPIRLGSHKGMFPTSRRCHSNFAYSISVESRSVMDRIQPASE